MILLTFMLNRLVQKISLSHGLLFYPTSFLFTDASEQVSFPSAAAFSPISFPIGFPNSY